MDERVLLHAVSRVWLMMSGCWFYGHSLGIRYLESMASTLWGSILFANHKANGVVTNIGLLANTVDDTGSYMAG